MELKDFYNRRRDLQNEIEETIKSVQELKAPNIEDSQKMTMLEMELRLAALKISKIRENHVELLQEQFCEPKKEPEEEEEESQVEPETAPAPAVTQPVSDMVGAIVTGLGAFASAWTMYQQQRKR